MHNLRRTRNSWNCFSRQPQNRVAGPGICSAQESGQHPFAFLFVQHAFSHQRDDEFVQDMTMLVPHAVLGHSSFVLFKIVREWRCFAGQPSHPPPQFLPLIWLGSGKDQTHTHAQVRDQHSCV